MGKSDTARHHQRLAGTKKRCQRVRPGVVGVDDIDLRSCWQQIRDCRRPSVPTLKERLAGQQSLLMATGLESLEQHQYLVLTSAHRLAAIEMEDFHQVRLIIRALRYFEKT